MTREAFLESGNMRGRRGRPSRPDDRPASRRGADPGPLRGGLRLDDLTVMGDRTGFAWTEPPAYGKIDELVAAKWKRMKILPSASAPTPSSSAASPRPDRPAADGRRRPQLPGRHARQPRQARRAGRPPDRQRPSTSSTGPTSGPTCSRSTASSWASRAPSAFRNWIRDQVAANTPYDKFVRTILTASGSNRENPPAAYFKILRDPAATMENTTQLFLAVRFNCNKCHDHPFERWTQDQYYQTAAYFAQVGPEGRPGERGPDDRRHRGRGGQAALRDGRRHGHRRGHPRPDQAGDARRSSRSRAPTTSRPRPPRGATSWPRG